MVLPFTGARMEMDHVVTSTRTIPHSTCVRRTHLKSRLTKIGGEVKQRIGYKGGLSLDTQYRRMGHTHVRMEALESVSARARACLQLVFLRCLSEYTLIYIKYACLQTSK